MMRIKKYRFSILIMLFASLTFAISCVTDQITGVDDNETELENEEVISDGVVRLPVVFHVLYEDATNINQYVDADRISELIENVNAFFRADTLDSMIEFYLSTTDDNGNKISLPGIDYQMVSDCVYSCEDFMNGDVDEAMDFLWDPNIVINIFVYTFTETNVLGIAHVPFTQSGDNELAGTTIIAYSSLRKSNLSFPYGLSINNDYFYENTVISGTNIKYSDEDTSATLAHELGHHLGLLHVFSTEDDALIYTDEVADIDYCEDTNLYNREEYLTYVQKLNRYVFTYFDDYCMRTDTNTGESFISYNIMDYYYSYSNSFTPNQVERMTHMTNYAVINPAVTSSKSRSSEAPEGVLDLPIKTYISTTEGCECCY